MPVVVAKGVIIVAAAAVAAAIAVYESPQARQFAEDIRRRIAVALHSLGDEINPASQQPRFNRPEDAQGFMQSRASAAPGVEADEESHRRQREELMYWNAVHLEKMAEDAKLARNRPEGRSRGSSFDDFLKQDESAEKGTFVYNTGADANRGGEEGLRNRGVQGLSRGSVYANPFGDEHGIDADEQRAIDESLMSPEVSEKDEIMSDIYNASEDPRAFRETTATTATLSEQLVDISDPPVSYPAMDDATMAETTDYTNMAPRDDSAYASIHAWADNANNSFYSPLPMTPRATTPQQREVVPGSPTYSDPDVSVPGDLTPTDTMSLAGSGEEVWAPRSGATSEADVMSVTDGRGTSTPGSWSEVESVVSEDEVGILD